MEKDPNTHRKHQPGHGALPSGLTPGSLKMAHDRVELLRSRSVGILHQKGDPPASIRKRLHKELEPENQGKDPRSDTDGASCQMSLEEDRKKKNQDAQEKLVDESGKTEPEKSDSKASTTEEQDDACTKRCTSVAEEQEPESIKPNDLEKQKPSVFVEIELGDHTEEEAVTCAMGEERKPPMDTGDLSEEETRTSWVCCFPYTSRRKMRENKTALEKVLRACKAGKGGALSIRENKE
ncbi:uncharacterized protein C13orf46 homolog [Nannospalax galili]|uniref:uncharacterized protein C13orf46 homolog n=1 Tax=Nannospalax galili TaxID=1026970 RepID=UPI0004ED2014|nr:uncharacterized protein C13orf46 homolog [Nannospalax galili]